MDEVIEASLAAQKAALGASGSPPFGDPRPLHWNEELDEAAAMLRASTSAMQRAYHDGNPALAAETTELARAWRSQFDSLQQAARMYYFETRIDAARDDPRALAPIYAQLRTELGVNKPWGGCGTAHAWRALCCRYGKMRFG